MVRNPPHNGGSALVAEEDLAGPLNDLASHEVARDSVRGRERARS